jgi:hypothetical protein
MWDEIIHRTDFDKKDYFSQNRSVFPGENPISAFLVLILM